MMGALPCVPTFLPCRIQDIAPEAAYFCLQTKRFVENTLQVNWQGKHLLVAFSGGADSLALLLLLHYLAPVCSFKVSAAHLDHAFRADSQAEAAWCAQICILLGIPLHSKRMNWSVIDAQTGQEDAARQARYAHFATVQQEIGADWVCLGHQLNDLGEDVLMRLGRGSGWPALGGMVGVCPKRQILRPLLLQSRKGIEAFLSSFNLGYIVDESNASDAFLRNRVRNYVMPQMCRENPAFLESIAHLWQQAQLDRTYFVEVVPPPEVGSQTEPENTASGALLVTTRECVGEVPQPLRLRHYRLCLQEVGAKNVRMSQLFAVDAAWAGDKFPKTIQFSGEIKAIVKKKAIYWCKK